MKRLDDINHLICSPTTSVREALARIDRASPYLFQVIVDDGNHVIGTLTDGDVRRGLLHGASLDSPVEECMFRPSTVGHIDHPEDNLLKAKNLKFLPVVDKEGRLTHVLFPGNRADGPERALVMAGGFGRRLGTLTEQTPKPMLKVGGRPILEHIVSALESANVRNIDVAVHYLADQIDVFFKQRVNQVQINLLHEDRPLGTAGAVGLVKNAENSPLLVVNGDVVTHVDYKAMHDFHIAHGYDATIACTTHDIHVPYGIAARGEDGLVKRIDEKPTYSHFVVSGIYYLSPTILALVPANERIDMPEVIDIAIAAGLRIGIFPVHEYWIDIGLPDQFDKAERDVASEEEPAGA